MELVLKRTDADKYRTHGELFVDGDSFCRTLEDGPAHLGGEGKGCIPAGRYEVKLTWSSAAKVGHLWTPWPDFQLPLLVGVSGFEGVRIHAGNTAKDTEGCVLVGLGYTTDALTQSRPALIKLMKELTSPASIDVRDVAA